MLRVSVLCTMLMLSLLSFSQDKVITGKVTDAKDASAIVGATVTAKGSRIATQTKPDGTYSLAIPAGTKSLIFSSVGFTTQEIAIAGKSSVDVNLIVNNASLGELVVVAYGTRRRGDLTGAVTSVNAKTVEVVGL